MSLSHTLLAIFINLVWGSMFIVATIALREFPPILFTGIRFTLLTLILVAFIPVPRHLLLPLFRVGLVLGVGMYLTLYLSLSLAENTAAIAIVGKLEVPFSILLGVLILGERIGIRRTAGITIAMAGALMIGFDPAALDDLPALWWMAISSAFGALSMIMVRQLREVHPFTITAWMSLIGAPTMLLLSAIMESDHLSYIQNASLTGWTMLAYTIVMGSIISHTTMYYLLQRNDVSKVSPFFLLSPVFAVIGGVWLLDDVLTPALIAGGVLVLFGVGWINQRGNKKC